MSVGTADVVTFICCYEATLTSGCTGPSAFALILGLTCTALCVFARHMYVALQCSVLLTASTCCDAHYVPTIQHPSKSHPYFTFIRDTRR